MDWQSEWFNHSIDDGNRRATLAALEEGSVRYIIATTCANIGIDMTVTIMVCVDILPSFEEMIQWAGQASHDGSRGCWLYMEAKT